MYIHSIKAYDPNVLPLKSVTWIEDSLDVERTSCFRTAILDLSSDVYETLEVTRNGSK